MATPEVISAGERAALRWLEHLLPNRPVIFDVGANAGDWSVLALARWPHAKLVCLEPQAAARAELWTRVGQFRSTILDVGLSSVPGEDTFFATEHPKCFLAGLHRRHDEHAGHFDRAFKVRLRTLPQVMAEQDVASIDLLKLDVEGHEFEVLRGAMAVLGERVAVIQFEFNECAKAAGSRFVDFWTLLRARGYELLEERDDGEPADSLRWVRRPSSHDASYLPQRNYLAVHRSVAWR